MNKNGKITNKILAMIPIVIVAVLCAWFCYYNVWSGDSISYGFFVSPDTDNISYNRIETIGQIWQSQINHYHTTNGRFFCHYLVQIFCALLPKFWFAVANGIVSLLFILLLTGFAHGFGKQCIMITTTSASLFWLACIHLSFEPPFIINYVWMGAMVCLWIYVFFIRTKFHSWWSIIFWAIFSFLAGEGNESFTIPVCAAIILYFFKSHFRLNKLQWIGALSFGAGGLILCLAPGNFIRIEAINSIGEQPSLFLILGYMAEGLIPISIIPAIFLSLILFNRQFRKNIKCPDNTSLFLWFTMCFSLILWIILAYHNFVASERVLYVDLIAITILIITNLPHIKRKIQIIVVVCAFLCIMTSATNLYYTLTPLNDKFTMITDLYHVSESGIVVLPDNIFVNQKNYTAKHIQEWVQSERASNPSKPWLRIYPESLTKINFQADTNCYIPFMNQCWIIIQSRHRPANFFINKTLLPNVLGIQMHSRPVDFSQNIDLYLDSTENSRVGIYINKRPYIESSISMESCE